MRISLKIVALCLFTTPLTAAIKTVNLDYTDGSTRLQGSLFYDDAKPGPLPAVLVVHEWKGLGEYAKGRARQLAELGYAAFAVDMYGKGVYAKDHTEAGKFSGVYMADRSLMRSRIAAGLKTLRAQKVADPSRVAAIGYCFGGTTVLELARSGADVKGVASFHGNLATPVPALPGAVQAKVLVFHGASDAWTAGGLADFQNEMTESGADWQLVSYGGAVHSFTVKSAGNDSSTGMAYNEAADRRSWQALLNFLNEVLAR